MTRSNLANLYEEFPRLRDEWITELNGDMRNFTRGMHNKVSWKCQTGKCKATGEGHIYVAAIHKRTTGTDCPICYGRKFCDCEFACGSAWDKLSDELKDEWVPELNGDLKKISTGCREKKLWYGKGDNCKCATTGKNHIYLATISQRVSKKTKCAVCAGRQICQCENACNSIWYLNPEFRDSWDGDIEEMKKYTPRSNKKFPWKCYCGGCKTTGEPHRFEAIIDIRTKNINYCPMRGSKKICPCDQACNSAWYVLPELREEWAADIEEMKNVFPYSETKHDWRCPKCEHIYSAAMNNRAAGKACPKCRESKLEKTTSIALEALEVRYKRGKSFYLCRDINPLPFDFYLPDYELLIELQGEQHFRDQTYYHKKCDLNNRLNKDLIKLRYALENGYSFLSISYKTLHKDIKKVIRDTIKLLEVDDNVQYCCLHYNLDNYWLISAVDDYSPEFVDEVSSVYIEQANLAREILQNL